MNHNEILTNSIENVMQLMDNSIIMLKDLDKLLSKYGFQPINGNAIGAETSKSIYQSSEQYATFFPQYMARPYALKEEMDQKKVKKIIFINIQFYHGDYEGLAPTLISGVIILPSEVNNIKETVKSWWLKNVAFELLDWEEVKKQGEINEKTDDSNYVNIFWCNDLLSFSSQQDLQTEVDKLVYHYRVPGTTTW